MKRPNDCRAATKKLYTELLRKGEEEVQRLLGTLPPKRQAVMKARLGGESLQQVRHRTGKPDEYILTAEAESLKTLLATASVRRKTSDFRGVSVTDGRVIVVFNPTQQRPISVGSFADEIHAALYRDVVVRCFLNWADLNHTVQEVEEQYAILTKVDGQKFKKYASKIPKKMEVLCPCGHRSTVAKGTMNRKHGAAYCASCGSAFDADSGKTLPFRWMRSLKGDERSIVEAGMRAHQAQLSAARETAAQMAADGGKPFDMSKAINGALTEGLRRKVADLKEKLKARDEVISAVHKELEKADKSAGKWRVAATTAEREVDTLKELVARAEAEVRDRKDEADAAINLAKMHERRIIELNEECNARSTEVSTLKSAHQGALRDYEELRKNAGSADADTLRRIIQLGAKVAELGDDGLELCIELQKLAISLKNA